MNNNYHCPKCGTREVTIHSKKKWAECNKCGHYNKIHKFQAWKHHTWYYNHNERDYFATNPGTFRKRSFIEDPEGEQ